MYICASWLGIAGHARVISGMSSRRIGDRQRACLRRQFSAHIDSSIDVVVDHSVIVIPKHVAWILGAL